jgi:signal-transduction protein with cAMP-binding, CBS, and nucleotidyltransferase domain
METMTMQRVRHLPVIRDGRLAGIVSIGDVVKQLLHEAQFELESLPRMSITTSAVFLSRKSGTFAL